MAELGDWGLKEGTSVLVLAYDMLKSLGASEEQMFDRLGLCLGWKVERAGSQRG